MKNYTKLLLAVFGVAFVSFNFAARADDRAGVVTLVHVIGGVEYSVDGGHMWIPAVVGKDFQPGTLIRTEDKSLADILIGQSLPDRNVGVLEYPWKHYPAPNIVPEVEKNMIRLQPNTVLGVDKIIVPDSDPTVVSDCELNLKKGGIFATVKKVSPSSEYLVKIPNGVAAVRGTQFGLETDGSDSSCQVVSGTVWLSFTLVDANGNPLLGPDGSPLPPLQISLNPGQQFDLDGHLLHQLKDILTAAGVSAANLQNIISQITNLANGAISDVSPGELTTLNVILTGLSTLHITITAPGNNNYLPPDNGTPTHISTL